MKQKKYCASLLSIFLIICLLLTGCSSPSIPTNANTAFQNFTRNLFKQDVVSTTIGLHYTLQNPESYGIEKIPITYGPTNANTAFQNFTRNLFKQDVVSTTIGLHYTLQNPESYGIEKIPITYGSFDVNEAASMKNRSVLLPEFKHNFRFCSLSINFFLPKILKLIWLF